MFRARVPWRSGKLQALQEELQAQQANMTPPEEMKDPEKIAAWKDEKLDRIKAEGERRKAEIMGEADRLKEKYEDELKKNKEEIELLMAEIPGGEKVQKMVMDALEGKGPAGGIVAKVLGMIGMGPKPGAVAPAGGGDDAEEGGKKRKKKKKGGEEEAEAEEGGDEEAGKKKKKKKKKKAEE